MSQAREKTQILIDEIMHDRRIFWKDNNQRDKIVFDDDDYNIIDVIKENEERDEESYKRLIIVHKGPSKLVFKKNWNNNVITRYPVLILVDDEKYNINPTKHEFFKPITLHSEHDNCQYISQCDPVSRYYGLKQGDIITVNNEYRKVYDEPSSFFINN